MTTEILIYHIYCISIIRLVATSFKLFSNFIDKQLSLDPEIGTSIKFTDYSKQPEHAHTTPG